MTKKKKSTKVSKEQELKLRKHQAGSMLFLCGALTYFIVGQGLVQPADQLSTTVHAPIILQTTTTNSDDDKCFPTEVGEISIGTQLNEQQRIDSSRKSFSRNTEKIHLSVELINSNKGEVIEGKFYYYESKSTDPMLLSSSSATLTDKSQDVVVFTLTRPGNQWQLRGKFKATIQIPASNIEKEVAFTIY
ncbi:MAG: hypothetical protein U9O20_04580 [Patescibacteria group bacterium]|nr:hypothetical protein [Patescibacteria group bacterium]